MNLTINTLLDRIGELPPMQEAAQKALIMIRHPDTNMRALAEVLSTDQILASLVLRWANSAYYGLSAPVKTVQQAVVVLGKNTIQSLLFAATLANLLNRPAPGYALDRGALWKHSIGVAAGARLIAGRYNPALMEEAYHAGLLCDVGKLALEFYLRDVQFDREKIKNMSFIEIETGLLGLDHAVIGKELAHRWNLPVSLQNAIAFHHRPSQAGDAFILASAVHLADAATMLLGIGIGSDGLQYPLDEAALIRLNWSEDGFTELFDKIPAAVSAAVDLIGMTK
ncbi:MAG: HDOD domain-containing protein [Chloroflexi bacterium]|nr:HDOD domain-containing protein [Chloroflexota bacterium]